MYIYRTYYWPIFYIILYSRELFIILPASTKMSTFRDQLLIDPTNDTRIQTNTRLRHEESSIISSSTTKWFTVVNFASFILGIVKTFPLGYIFFYYVPSPLLLSPLALQTMFVAVGAASFLIKSKKCGTIIWFLTSLLDLAFTIAVLLVVYPLFGEELVSEPDGTINIYMRWIPLYFHIFFVLGFTSSLLNLIGLFMSAKQLNVNNIESHDNTEEQITFTIKTHQTLVILIAISICSSLILLTLGCIDIGTGLKKIPPASASVGGAEKADSTESPQCDPLLPFECSLPFPSSFWTEEDKHSVTGQKLDLKSVIPSTRWSSSFYLGQMFHKRSFLNHDGFSTVAPILFGFEHEVKISTLVGASNISLSLNKKRSTTFLIHSETGDLIPHFVDKDYFDPTFGLNDEPNDERRLLILQPAIALDHNSTYVVAIVPGMRYESSGDLVPIPTEGYFAALRDDNKKDSSYDEKRAKNMNKNVWPALLKAGIDRKTLLLSFSFKTISRLASLGKFEQIRNAALLEFEKVNNKSSAAAAATADDDDGMFDYEITKVVESASSCSSNSHTTIARTLHGHFMSPNYLIHPGPSATTGFVASDDMGLYHKNGVAQVNFLIRIPCSVYNGSRAVSTIIQYGHGLFGSRAEAMDDYLGRVSNNYGALIVATDWKGMSKYDVPMALRIFTKKIEEFSSMPERTQQGWIDMQLFMKMLRNKKIGLRHNEHLMVKPVKGKETKFIIDETTPISYYGNSQGSVIGGGYFSSSLELSHGVLGVPGCPFSLLLSRSKDFAPYHLAMKFQIWNALDLRIYLSLMQNLWDSAESGGWLTNIVRPPNFDDDNDISSSKYQYPKKHVLLQAALGDAQVTTVAAEFMARTLKASTIHPETRYVFDVPERHAPWNVDISSGSKSGSNNALVEWLYDDAPPVRRDRDLPPADGKDTHECPRRESRAQAQLIHFLVHHEIVQTCGIGKICESKTCPSGHSNN
jgi:hypothetical protein